MDCTFKQVAHSLLQLVYPSLCLHCHVALKKRGVLFCPACLEQISLIETKGRCWTCFSELYRGRCEQCMRRSVVIHRQIAACEAMGPARSLLKGLHEGWMTCIRAAASLMAYQWLEQKLPLPECLVPLPIAFWHKQRRGFDLHFLLAKELGAIFSIPVISCLNKIIDTSHFFTRGECQYRLVATGKNGSVLCDRRVLLVAPKLDDALLRSAGIALKEYFPIQIDALALSMDVE
jgi:predicted amidophosphoribosyltransferase